MPITTPTKGKPSPGSLVVCAGTVTIPRVSGMGSGFNLFKEIFSMNSPWVATLQTHLDNHFSKNHSVSMPAYLSSIATKDELVGSVATVPVFNSQLDQTNRYEDAVRGAVKDAIKLGRPLYIQPLGIGVYGWKPEIAATLFLKVIQEEDPHDQLNITIPMFNASANSADLRFKEALHHMLTSDSVAAASADDVVRVVPDSSKIVDFDTYIQSLERIASRENRTLNTAARIVQSTLADAHKDNVKVIAGVVNLATLEPGYYLRFISLGGENFHLYGVEVTARRDVIVHENIAKSRFNNHADLPYRDQLNSLARQGKVYFRTALEPGGGLDVHADLASQYSKTGDVGRYQNQGLSSAVTVLPQPIVAAVAMESLPYATQLEKRFEQYSHAYKTFEERTQAIAALEKPVRYVAPGGRMSFETAIIGNDSLPDNYSNLLRSLKAEVQELTTRRTFYKPRVIAALVELQREVGMGNQHSSTGAYRTAINLLKTLNEAGIQYFNNPAITAQTFTETCRVAISKVKNELENDLGWGAMLANLLKSLVNAVTFGYTSGLFPPERTKSVEAAEKATLALNESVRPAQ